MIRRPRARPEGCWALALLDSPCLVPVCGADAKSSPQPEPPSLPSTPTNMLHVVAKKPIVKPWLGSIAGSLDLGMSAEGYCCSAASSGGEDPQLRARDEFLKQSRKPANGRI